MYKVLNTVSAHVMQFSRTLSRILLLPPLGPRSGENLPTLSYTRVACAGSSLRWTMEYHSENVQITWFMLYVHASY